MKKNKEFLLLVTMGLSLLVGCSTPSSVQQVNESQQGVVTLAEENQTE